MLTTESQPPVEFSLPLNDRGFDRIFSVGIIEADRPLLFLALDVYEFIRSHSKQNEPREVGGVLLGQYCVDKDVRFLVAPTAVACGLGDATPVSISFPPTFWQEVEEVQTAEYPGFLRLGPFHSHPGYGVHPSSVDQRILRAFSRAHNISLIYDPHADQVGYTCWQDQTIMPPSGCFIYEHQNPDRLIQELTIARQA